MAISAVALFASIGAAQITANSQYQVGSDQIKSAAEKEKHDRRHEAYTGLFASLTAKREALVSMRCEDRAPGNSVDREQQLALDALAKEADAAWNQSLSRTDLYATNRLRTAIRDLKFVELSTHSVKGSAGVLLGPNPGSPQEYAACEATFANFDSKVVAIRKVIQEDLGMDDS